MDGSDGGALGALFGRVPDGLERRVVALEAGADLAYEEAAWRDSIVLVAAGAVELECAAGCRRRFGRGAVLWLSPLPLRRLLNPGAERAVLIAVSRRRGRPARRPA